MADVGKVLGRVASGWWAQVHDFVAEGEKGHKRGHLVAAASLHRPSWGELEAVATGREVLARLHELYYGNLAGDSLVALRRAAVGLRAEFAEVELVGVALVGQAICVVVAGEGGVWAKVGGKQGWLVNPYRIAADLSALSGWSQAGQVLVVGNSRFWQTLTLGTVRAAVANAASAAEAAEALGAVVRGNDRGVGGVGMVIEIRNSKFEIRDNVPNSNFKNWNLFRISSFVLRILPRVEGPIYISSVDKTRSRRRNMWLGVGFLLLLLFLVGGWQWRGAYLANKLSEHEQQIEDLTHKFNQAQALVELNPVRSRQLLSEIEIEIEKRKDVKKKDERVRRIEAEFGAVLGVATGVRQATATEVLDLGWLREGMVGSRLALVSDRLVVLDTAAGRLVVVDPGKKSGEVIAGKADLGEAKLLAVYPGKAGVLSDKGIVECQIPDGKCQVVVSPDPSWGEAIDMDMFAGNIYLLTRLAIWRYQVTESGYSPAQSWLASSEDSSGLSLSSNMAIDGFIWVMLTDGQITKYARGVEESFAVVEVDKPFAPGPIIYTDSEVAKLYVLDRGNGRVVVLAKTGAYQLQYQFDQAKEGVDLAVDEKGGKLYVLAGSKIWEVDL